MRLFIEQLTNIDFSYLSATRGIVGETWLANIELIGELNEQGMVSDFSVVKQSIRNWFDSKLDHTLAVPSNAPHCEYLLNDGQLSFAMKTEHGMIKCSSPRDAIADVPVEAITADSVSAWCEKELIQLFPDTVKSLKVNFSTEPTTGPYYHYTHGLKKHSGNCQRIAHGHRSKILIWQNGNLEHKLIQYWADTWNNIYIGTHEDVTEQTDDSVSFAYLASQGQFELSLPKRCCYLIESDSTVELIAQHIAQTLKDGCPTNTYKVKAYEGMGKGAIVEV